MVVPRIKSTPQANDIINQIHEEHGDLIFCLAGGCCEGTQPQCLIKGSYYPRTNDVMIGKVQGFEFWVDRDLFEYWQYSQLELDVLDGWGPGGFSLETPLGKTFKLHYRIFEEAELEHLEPIIRK